MCCPEDAQSVKNTSIRPLEQMNLHTHSLLKRVNYGAASRSNFHEDIHHDSWVALSSYNEKKKTLCSAQLHFAGAF